MKKALLIAVTLVLAGQVACKSKNRRTIPNKNAPVAKPAPKQDPAAPKKDKEEKVAANCDALVGKYSGQIMNKTVIISITKGQDGLLNLVQDGNEEAKSVVDGKFKSNPDQSGEILSCENGEIKREGRSAQGLEEVGAIRKSADGKSLELVETKPNEQTTIFSVLSDVPSTDLPTVQ